MGETMTDDFDALNSFPRKVLPGATNIDWEPWGQYQDIFLDTSSLRLTFSSILRSIFLEGE